MKDTMKDIYISCASGLGMGDFTKVKTGKDRTDLITKIADIYCNATDKGDELIRSQAISALMLLFWGEISKMSDKCKAVDNYEYEDFSSKLYECINEACVRRGWVNNTTTAEACIRAVIGSRGAPAVLYESNLDKNKANINTASLNAAVNDDEGHEVTKLDLVEDLDSEKHRAELAARLLIQKIIDKGDLIASIILDQVAFGDSLKETKLNKLGHETITDKDGTEIVKEFKYSVNKFEYSENYLVKTLNNLPEYYRSYFLSNYDVKEAAFDAALNRMKTINSTKMHKFVRDTLIKQKAVFQN